MLVATILLLIPSLCFAGEDLGDWNITRYYTPVPGQERYYNGWSQNYGKCATKNLYYIGYNDTDYKGDYEAEACMQGQGDIFVTADGTNLKDSRPYSIAACPRNMLGQTLHIEGIGYVKCRDTGGAIKGRKIDIWTGIGMDGYNNIQKIPGGLLQVHKKVE